MVNATWPCHEFGSGESIYPTCLQSAIPSRGLQLNHQLTRHQIPLTTPEHHKLMEPFPKDLALSLPLHRPYDGTFDLLLGVPLPSSRLFSLSEQKQNREAMEKYCIYRRVRELGFTFWGRNIYRCVPVLTTEDLIISLWRTIIHCLWLTD